MINSATFGTAYPRISLRSIRATGSTEHKVGADAGDEQRQCCRQDQLGAETAGGMGLLVIEPPPGPDKSHGCGHDEGQADEDESKSVVTAKRPRYPFELQPMARIKRACACHRQHEQIELLDDEPERDHGDAGAHPGEKRSLVGGMITIAANHERPR